LFVVYNDFALPTTNAKNITFGTRYSILLTTLKNKV